MNTNLNITDWFIVVLFAGVIFHQIPVTDAWKMFGFIMLSKIAATIVYKIVEAFKKAAEVQRARAPR